MRRRFVAVLSLLAALAVGVAVPHPQSNSSAQAGKSWSPDTSWSSKPGSKATPLGRYWAS